MKYWDEPVTNTLSGRPLLAALTVCCAIGFLLCVGGGVPLTEDFETDFLLPVYSFGYDRELVSLLS